MGTTQTTANTVKSNHVVISMSQYLHFTSVQLTSIFKHVLCSDSTDVRPFIQLQVWLIRCCGTQ